MASDRVTSASPARAVGLVGVTHELWEQTTARRNLLARQAALAVLADRLEEAKGYASAMLAAEAAMDGITQQLDQEPSGKKSIR